MQKMKTGLILVLIVALVLTLSILSGCKNTTAATTAVETTVATTAVETTASATAAETTAAGGTMTPSDQWKEKSLGIMFPSGIVNDTYAAVYQGMLDWASVCKFKTPEMVQGEYDISKMIAAGETLIAKKMDALVFWPIDPAAFVPLFKKANDAGIPVASINSLPESGASCVLASAGADDEAGKACGERMVELLTKKYGEAKGTILECEGIMAMTDAQSRHNSFANVIKQYPNIKIIERQCKWDPAEANKAVLDVFASETVDAIYSHTASMTPGIYGALSQMNMLQSNDKEGHIIYISINASSQDMDYVRQGIMDAIGDWQVPTTYGMGVCFLRMALEGFTPSLGDTLTAEQMKEWGFVGKDDLWSPGKITNTDRGPLFNAHGYLIDKSNVDDKSLWGNQDFSNLMETGK